MKKMIPGFLVAAALLAAPLSVYAADTISVTGNGEVKVDPDMSYVDMAVVTKDKDVSRAQAENARLSDQLRKALVAKFGLEKNDVRSTGYSVNPNYQYPPNSAAVLVGYTVQNSLQVTVRDLSKTGELIDVAGANGANEIPSVTFSNSHLRDFRSEALKQAYADAQLKAQALAQASNRNLGRAVAIVESGSSSPVRQAQLERSAASAGAAPPRAPTVVTPGQLTVSAYITVQFEM